MAMVECKECGGQISQNAETCPHCADVIKEPKAKFSLVDLIHKVSVPVVLSIAGTMITIRERSHQTPILHFLCGPRTTRSAPYVRHLSGSSRAADRQRKLGSNDE